jgi:serine/threonine protein kinase
MSSESGRHIRFLRPLGRGGFGAVHLADVTTADGLVQRMAIKLLHGELGLDLEMQARARDEARLLAQVNHDNVVKVFGLTEVEGRVAVLMEFVEGVDCATLLLHARRNSGAGMAPRIAARICECAASALHAAWAGVSPQSDKPLHIVHRDIKPTNILLSRRGAVKVMDFGVARGEIEREAQTAAHSFGTRRYMAPERILDRTAGHPSDVYALGATFFELVTGTRFEALVPREDAFARGLAQRIEEIRDLEESWGTQFVGSGLGKLLAWHPEDRLSAAEAESMFASWGDALPGPELRRFAQETVPGLLERREKSLGDDTAPSGSILTHHSFSEATPTPSRSSALFRGLGLALGVLAVFWSLQQRQADLEEAVAPKSVFEEPAPVVPAKPAPPPPVVTAPVKDPAPAAKPRATVPVRASPRAPVSVETPTAEPRSPPDNVLEWVSLKILADPREGQVGVMDQSVEVGGRITLPVGAHTFRFIGAGWDVMCRVSVTPATRRIKFVKEDRSCELF